MRCKHSTSQYFADLFTGVILQTYGTGNVPSENTELIDILRKAHKEDNILLLNVTQCWKGTVANVYATGTILNSVGAVSGCVSNQECLLNGVITKRNF